jgi:uncharacterized protein YigA (DUF484 family)
MSDSQVAEMDECSEVTDEEVISFLRNNPSFLQNYPEVCDFLVPPKQASDRKVTDFQAYMISRLRADKDAVIETTREIVENSRANMNNQHRVHKAILLLLEARSFEDFIHIVTMDISAILDVDIAALIIESNGRDIPHIHTSGIRVVAEGTIDRWMGEKSVMLQSDIQGIEPIYGGGATLVASQALLRVDISMNTPPALLAFGSRAPHGFVEGQATDQVLFLARVIERCFRSWLDLPL